MSIRKFHVISTVIFASLSSGTVLTDRRQEEFEDAVDIIMY